MGDLRIRLSMTVSPISIWLASSEAGAGNMTTRAQVLSRNPNGRFLLVTLATGKVGYALTQPPFAFRRRFTSLSTKITTLDAALHFIRRATATGRL